MNNYYYINEINKLKKQKNAIILAHYYQKPEIQDIADVLGDSLALAQSAHKTKADIIVFAGVHFMAETAKLLNPDKKVILPDLAAGCSLADSCKKDDFLDFKKNYKNHKVISYINSSIEIKALSDILCTSSNAVKIVDSFPNSENLIFLPDYNLGKYLNDITGRNMVLWPGACHVHARFSLQKILDLKQIHKEALILAHPECPEPIRIIADFIGSTSELLKFAINSNQSCYIIATESGIIHQMNKQCPEKEFIPAPPEELECGCNDCFYMKLITLEKIYNALVSEKPEILIEEELLEKAALPLKRMLELS